MKRYILHPPIPDEVNETFASYTPFIRELLYSRGIRTIKDAEVFLNPSYEEGTHNPFLIKGMERAVLRILKAISGGEHITVYSDYDHDGIPGGVIIYDFFKKIGYHNFENYIPHRYTEGYGLNKSAVEKLAKGGTTLIITVDCGITDKEPVQRANELGVDVIITDHHLPASELPPAYVILNSKQKHCKYPFDMLCGAAVAFKLIQALIERGNFPLPKGWEKWLLDLVGLSTIADMVPLQGENRVLAHYGLKVLKKTRRPGLQKLLHRMNINSRFLTEDDIGFMLAPRINAASRMGDPRLAFELLTVTEEDGRSDTLAAELEKLNEARKGVVASMVKNMKAVLKERQSIPSIIVMGNPSWRPGLLGLAANNILEEHNRPVFLWGREGGEVLKGSCRSDGTVDVVTLMQKVPTGLFIEFGGHALSGGFSVFPEKIHYLERYLIETYEEIREEIVKEAIFVDKKISVNDIDRDLWDNVSLLAPFGIKNPKPLFLLEGEEIKKVRWFGKKNEHLELTFEKDDGTKIKAISFFYKTPAKEFKEGRKINLVGNLEKSFFGFRPELRLRIVDIL